MAKIPVGVQLYSVRDDCARDLPGTLAAISKMGYAGVEFAGYYGYSAVELRRMLDDLGLKPSGSHIGFEQLLGDALPKTAEFHLTLGNKHLIVPGLPEAYRDTPKAWLATAELFNSLAARLQPYGLRVGYHNHDEEFHKLEGQIPFDVFFGHTNPDVIMQMDVHHVIHGGGDPVACLKRYPGRAVTLHMSDYKTGDQPVLLGDGQAPWKEIFDQVDAQGQTAWYIVEQESYFGSPLDSIAACLDGMRKMGKA
jgi:sugar phosphate isomerase/epimerase